MGSGTAPYKHLQVMYTNIAASQCCVGVSVGMKSLKPSCWDTTGLSKPKPCGCMRERERQREYMYTACSHYIAMVHTCLSELPFNHVLYVLHTYVRMYYTVEPLYRGHHQDPAGCPVYSGTSLQRTPLGPSWLSCIQWNLSIVDIIGTQLAVL